MDLSLLVPVALIFVSVAAATASLLWMLTDPQTAGGLLVACAPERVAQVIDIFRSHGFAAAAQIGSMAEGNGRVAVR